MSSKAYGSDDKLNFELDFTPRNKCLPMNVPGITPDKLNKENLEQLLGNYTPVITVSSSSASEKRSSKFMNPFNDTNSSEPRNSKIIHNDELQSSNSSNLQYLLPPISFSDNKNSIYEKEALEFSVRNYRQNSAFARGMKYILQSSRNLSNDNDNLPVSSPTMPCQDVVIDKDLLTSEVDNYNDHLYPWIPKQDSEGYNPLVESTLIQPDPPEETSNYGHIYTIKSEFKEEDIIPRSAQDYGLASDNEKCYTNKMNTKVTKKTQSKGNRKNALLFTILIKPDDIPKETNKLSDKEKDQEVCDIVSYLEDRDQRGKPIKDDDEYLPAYKITRSRSRKSRINLTNYVQDKKKKLGPRSKSGCWTCRVRHKSCPEERPTCSQCLRLNLKCDYSSKRPTYMVDPVVQANKLKEIRSITFKQKRNNFTKVDLHSQCN